MVNLLTYLAIEHTACPKHFDYLIVELVGIWWWI